MLQTSELDYDLPEERIAVEPVSPRDSARLMVVERARGRLAEHAAVRDLPRLLRAGDVLVFNTTRVLPARLLGKREDTGGAVEGLFLSRANDEDVERWTVLLRAKKVRSGMRFSLEDPAGASCGVTLIAIEKVPDEAGAWLVAVENKSGGDALERAGHTPLPPYIIKAREHLHRPGEEADDAKRYQTVYADAPGSVAAPTAGLHFTPQLLTDLRRIGVERVDVTLHVGTGTFRPIEASIVEQHPMHSERCFISKDALRRIVRAKSENRRVIAVGTTSARTLESFAANYEALITGGASEEQAIGRLPDFLDTSLLITPGYRWNWVSGLLTNFHLPRSTLLAMVGAFLTETQTPLRTLRDLYAEAIRQKYRFYSYGDAMLLH
ncbi:MAG: tRNA preQ1(34) S-adenosylmethionine ribosyltransferase-isomerase QueA [Phycisphaeraceae bacterium]|nr:tRNA preQ1(34) S-adenosylmethionine ribosyltransferase-isomerase QueA [Phycisphaeraceae bacterium]